MLHAQTLRTDSEAERLALSSAVPARLLQTRTCEEARRDPRSMKRRKSAAFWRGVASNKEASPWAPHSGVQTREAPPHRLPQRVHAKQERRPPLCRSLASVLGIARFCVALHAKALRGLRVGETRASLTDLGSWRVAVESNNL